MLYQLIKLFINKNNVIKIKTKYDHDKILEKHDIICISNNIVDDIIDEININDSYCVIIKNNCFATYKFFNIFKIIIIDNEINICNSLNILTNYYKCDINDINTNCCYLNFRKIKIKSIFLDFTTLEYLIYNALKKNNVNKIILHKFCVTPYLHDFEKILLNDNKIIYNNNQIVDKSKNNIIYIVNSLLSLINNNINKCCICLNNISKIMGITTMLSCILF